jgi:hypothetical protein
MAHGKLQSMFMYEFCDFRANPFICRQIIVRSSDTL